MKAPEVVIAQNRRASPQELVQLLRMEGWIFVSKPIVTEEHVALDEHEEPTNLLIRMDGYADGQMLTSRQAIPAAHIEAGPANLIELIRGRIGQQYALAVGKFLEVF